MWIWLLTGWVVLSFPLALVCGSILHRFGHESGGAVDLERAVEIPQPVG